MLIAMVPILIIRVMPDYMECYKIKQAVKAVAADSNGKTVGEIRMAFGKYAEVEHARDFTPANLGHFKNDNQIIVAFACEKRIPLFANVSLLIDLRNSLTGRTYSQ